MRIAPSTTARIALIATVALFAKTTLVRLLPREAQFFGIRLSIRVDCAEAPK